MYCVSNSQTSKLLLINWTQRTQTFHTAILVYLSLKSEKCNSWITMAPELLNTTFAKFFKVIRQARDTDVNTKLFANQVKFWYFLAKNFHIIVTRSKIETNKLSLIKQNEKYAHYFRSILEVHTMHEFTYYNYLQY